jgi:hypothetical protein
MQCGFISICESPPLPHPEIARRLGLPRTSNFRTFSLKFSRNYAAIPWQDKETVIIFVYLNGRAGGRARVLIVEPE